MHDDIFDTEALEGLGILEFFGVLCDDIQIGAKIPYQRFVFSLFVLLWVEESRTNIDSEPILSTLTNIFASGEPILCRNAMRRGQNPTTRNNRRTALMICPLSSKVELLLVSQTSLVWDFSQFGISASNDSFRVLLQWSFSASSLIAEKLIFGFFALWNWTSIPLCTVLLV